VARQLSFPLNIGRVIARPFIGKTAKDFIRTGNRKDYSVPPPQPTLLDHLTKARRDVVTVGKIGDIYAHSGTGREVKATGNAALMDATLKEMPSLQDGGLLMSNFVDFDMLYGHRRDSIGYGKALEYFDVRLPELMAQLRQGDLMILTADHGCDPTWKGTDHTRECVPVLCFAPGLAPGGIGRRKCFADIGQTLAKHLRIAPLSAGAAWSV
jgi:phosphopentomutase